MHGFRAARTVGLVCAALLSAMRAHGIVDTAVPVAGPPVVNAIPDLGVTGAFFDYPIQQKGPNAIHGGRVTVGFDIPDPPSPDPVPWALSITNPLATTATLALPAHLTEALAISNDQLTEFDSGMTEDLFAVFATAAELLGGDANVSIPARKASFRGYPPLRARWLSRQWGFGPGAGSPFPKEKLFEYKDPDVFREIRLRAARQYCAARSAQFEQGDAVSSLGERAAFSVNVLGQQIDFLVAESMLVLDGPERFTGNGVNDGAQAFAIPFLLGTRITPIRGIGLPGFDEIRVPLTMLTADSEVTNESDSRDVLVGWNLSCQWQTEAFPPIIPCTQIPKFVYQPSKQYHTVTHVDVALSADKTPSLTAHFPLFFLGGVRIDLGIEPLALSVGKLSAENQRVLETPLAGWPQPRTGRLFQNPLTGVRYHDGRWKLRPFINLGSQPLFAWFVLPDGETDPFWRTWFNNPVLSPPPLDVRLFNDDDRALVSTTELTLTSTVSGILGGKFGPFTVDLTVAGGITGTVDNDHLIREALLAADLGQPSMTPITALTVRPRMRANATLEKTKATLHLSLHIDLGLTSIDIDITKDLLSIPGASLANYDSDSALQSSDEQFNFRLGTGARDGDVMKQPAVLSHFPGRPEFNTFDVSVDTCLADEAPNPPPPPPCTAVTDPGEPPSAEICVFGPAFGTGSILGEPLPILPAPPQGVCGNINAYALALALAPAQKACVADLLAFLCQPISKQQIWQGKSVISRVLELTNAAQGQALADVVGACVNAFVPQTPDVDPDELKHAMDLVANALVHFGVCTDDATLLGDNEVIGAVTGTTPPPIQPGPPCH